MELILPGLDTSLRDYSTSGRKKSKVQRKPSGCAIIQFSFPPVDKAEIRRTLLQGRMGDQADKNAKDGRTIVCCCESTFPA
jgi:hypothetical protein